MNQVFTNFHSHILVLCFREYVHSTLKFHLMCGSSMVSNGAKCGPASEMLGLSDT